MCESQLEFLLNRDSNLSIATASSATGDGRHIVASESLAAGDIIGPSEGVDVRSVLDPVAVLRDHRVGRTIVDALLSAGRGDGDAAAAPAERKRVEEMAFWVSVAMLAREAAARRPRREDAGRPPKRRRPEEAPRQAREREVVDAYLLSLPRDGPDPCCWSEGEREEVLAGTPLFTQIDATLRRVKKTYDEVAEKFFVKNGGLEEEDVEQLPPFSILGRGTFPSVLWARSMHQSRSFPRALVDEEGVWWQGRKQYVPPAGGGSGAVVARGAETGEEGLAGDHAGRSTLVRFQLGGHRAPQVTIRKTAPSQSDDERPPEPERRPGSTLGIMLPLLDMLDHKDGQAVQWETIRQKNQRRSIVFRCVEPIAKGRPVWNNYGPKGNAELLATYGFATRDNACDSVDGIVLGLRAPSASPISAARKRTKGDDAGEREARDDDSEERRIFRARMEVIRERSLPHRFEDSRQRLLLGPFSLHRPLPTTAAGIANPGSDASDDDGEGVLPQSLFHALSVVGLEDAEEGPVVSANELEMLRDVLTKKMADFGPPRGRGRDEDSPSLALRRRFAEAYKDGQRQILCVALAELDSLMPR